VKHYTGLDASVRKACVCITNEMARFAALRRSPADPEQLLAVLFGSRLADRADRLETGQLFQWLFECRARAGSPVICIETGPPRSS
jgi:hypothetical protein